MIEYDSIILWSNFFENRFVIMFLIETQIKFFISYLIFFRCSFALITCFSCAFFMFSVTNFLISFISFVMSAALRFKMRSRMMFVERSITSKLIRELKSFVIIKENISINAKWHSLMTNFVIDKISNQLF